MRRRNASSLVLLMASLGVYVALLNVISLIFGDASKSLRGSVVAEGLNVLEARITPTQILIMVASVVLIGAVAIVLRLTGLGRAMRAVASDADLAKACGVNVDRVILAAFAIGSALAGAAGILVALDTSMTPTMGLSALMLAIVAVIIGGAGSLTGVVIGSLMLAFAQQLAIWYIGSQWQEAVAFVILFAFLLIRPQGVLGRQVRKVTV